MIACPIDCPSSYTILIVFVCIFYPRGAVLSVVLAVMQCLSICLSVRPPHQKLIHILQNTLRIAPMNRYHSTMKNATLWRRSLPGSVAGSRVPQTLLLHTPNLRSWIRPCVPVTDRSDSRELIKLAEVAGVGISLTQIQRESHRFLHLGWLPVSW